MTLRVGKAADWQETLARHEQDAMREKGLSYDGEGKEVGAEGCLCAGDRSYTTQQ